MTELLFRNNAVSVLDTGISDTATTLTVSPGHGARFPNPATGQAFIITVQEGTDFEVMRCTARSSDTLTVVRAQEGTTARAFSAGASVEMRVTAGIAGSMVQGPATLPASRVLGRGSGGAGIATGLTVTAPLAVGASELTISMDTARILGRTTTGTGAAEQLTVTSPLALSSGTLTTSMSSNRLLGRTTAGTGAVEQLSVAAPLALSSGTLTTSMSSNRLLGRTTTGTGAVEEIGLDSGSLEFNGSELRVKDNTFLPLAGGTMAGPLTLSGAPTNNLHAATKQYVDAAIAAMGGGLLNVAVITTSTTWTPTPGSNKYLMMCMGGGSGGYTYQAGVDGAGNPVYAVAGGTAGDQVWRFLYGNPGPRSCVIGAGGAGSNNPSNRGWGGSTYIDGVLHSTNGNGTANRVGAMWGTNLPQAYPTGGAYIGQGNPSTAYGAHGPANSGAGGNAAINVGQPPSAFGNGGSGIIHIWEFS